MWLYADYEADYKNRLHNQNIIHSEQFSLWVCLRKGRISWWEAAVTFLLANPHCWTYFSSFIFQHLNLTEKEQTVAMYRFS